MKDIAGQNLKIGDRVYFPIRESSSCFLAEGAVVRFYNDYCVHIRSFATGKINGRLGKDVVKVPKNTETVSLSEARDRYCRG